MRVNLLIMFLFGASISLPACTSPVEEPQKPTGQQPPDKPDDSNDDNGQPAPVYGHLTTENTVKDVIGHEAFAGFGQFILPAQRRYDDGMPLRNVASLLPYHNYITGECAVKTINTMIDYVHDGNRLLNAGQTCRCLRRPSERSRRRGGGICRRYERRDAGRGGKTPVRPLS